ncbi:MAG: Mur ligase domain-containing protein [Candidatus Magasanikbacteria bacterium]
MLKQSLPNTFNLTPNTSRYIHFIGICGVGMGALAIMMKKKGNKVTGSDVGFYPPISTHLKEHGIEYYAGWHPERIGGGCHSRENGNPDDDNMDPRFRGDDNKKTSDNFKPDIVVVGNVAGSENPEWKFVKENKIPFVSYPELVARELTKKNSIVCAGTYGKTSTTALLSWILINAGKKPAYMFGGLSQTPELASDDLGGEWSVLEGDEYKTSRWDNSPKFSHYSPTHLLLTAVKWDHADVYPTEDSYLAAFEKLVASVPKNGVIVISEQAQSVIPVKTGIQTPGSPIKSRMTKTAQDDNDTPQDDKRRFVKYGQSEDCDYQYYNIKSTEFGLNLSIKCKSKIYNLKSKIIGSFQAENICGAFAMAHSIGIEPEVIIKSIASFAGIKRRLEKRGTTITGATVFDDIAHSPAKAKSVLETIATIYKCHSERSEESLSVGQLDGDPSAMPQDDKIQPRLFCVFEPNSGNRKFDALPGYDHAFDSADEVIIPRLTKLKNDSEFVSGEQLCARIALTNANTIYIAKDDELLKYLNQKTRASDVVVFCGSHGFRGMIDEMVK